MFPKFGKNGDIYQARYGGVLSLFVKFSTRKKNKFVELHIFGRKKIRKIWKIEKLRENNVEIMAKKTLR